MKLTKAQAKKLSLLKWDYYRKINYYTLAGLLKNHPELSGLKNSCGYCELYYETDQETKERCPNCPLKKETGFACMEAGSLFGDYIFDPSKVKAEKIYQAIKKS